MSTATLMTVLERHTSRDGQLTATVLLLGDAYVVDLDDVRSGQTIERLSYGADRQAASRSARSLAWGEQPADDAAEDEAVYAMLADVASMVGPESAPSQDAALTPTPAGVSRDAAPVATPSPMVATPGALAASLADRIGNGLDIPTDDVRQLATDARILAENIPPGDRRADADRIASNLRRVAMALDGGYQDWAEDLAEEVADESRRLARILPV